MKLLYLIVFAIGAITEFLGVWLKEYATAKIKFKPVEEPRP